MYVALIQPRNMFLSLQYNGTRSIKTVVTSLTLASLLAPSIPYESIRWNSNICWHANLYIRSHVWNWWIDHKTRIKASKYYKVLTALLHYYKYFHCFHFENITVNLYVLALTISLYMMTSSNGNIFRVTGHLCGKFTGPRWISRTKASDAELWCFLWFTPE